MGGGRAGKEMQQLQGRNQEMPHRRLKDVGVDNLECHCKKLTEVGSFFSGFFLKKYLVPKTLAKQVAVSEPAAEGQIATDFEVGLSWNGEEL